MNTPYPMDFRIHIDMTNDAFLQPTYLPELNRILKVVADQVADGNVEGYCTDINGNTVGTFVIHSPEEEEE